MYKNIPISICFWYNCIIYYKYIKKLMVSYSLCVIQFMIGMIKILQYERDFINLTINLIVPIIINIKFL
jgi:hypothetical protein